MKTAPQIAFGSLVFFCAAILLPGSAAAQQQPLSVSPTSVSVQATVGTNAPSQTVQVKKRGKPTTQVSWSVVQQNATLAQRVADGRRERRHVDVDFHNVRAGGGAVSDLV